MSDPYVERVIDLTDPAQNRIHNMTLDVARARLPLRDPGAVREIDGSFAFVARDGRRVFLARSLDRPLRYFLAKQAAGPALVVSDRIDAIHAFLKSEGLDGQFHPSYTRMVPAHYVVEIELVGCPDPAPSYTRYFTPERNALPPDPAAIGPRYVGALCDEIAKWLGSLPAEAPVGVCFSGGVDSGAVFLATHHVLRRLGMSPARLKAFTLSVGRGEDLVQARAFLEKLGLGMFLETIEAPASAIDPFEAVRVVEDYKPLDVESATMALALCRGIRERYPDWRFLVDGDGGDENLKDYPIEENAELTIRSVVNNPLLYQEGWGVGKMKHSLTYSGGQSRSYSRTWAPLRRFGFDGFSPFTRPALIAVAEAIPFATMARGDTGKLYAIKGDVVSRGIAAITGFDMPVFPKRRFQHGALAAPEAERIAFSEGRYREHFLSLRVIRPASPAYPAADRDRDRWILSRRPPRHAVDPRRTYAALVETEPAAGGGVVSVAALFLTNRECPWRCLMCDLWKSTTTETVPPGAIPAQIREALDRLPPARQAKLYNAGSFFDPRAIPPEDHEEIAALVSPFENVIVESHPALVGDSCRAFRDRLQGRLEVAMGLETIHPGILPRLHKRMTLDGFRRAAAFLRDSGIGLRVFVLVGLPFAGEEESLEWARRSVEFAFDCGCGAVALIPTRAGNGALDALALRGEFAPPSLSGLEAALESGLGLGRGRVFADLWDLERLRRCAECFPARAARLERMNLEQAVLPRISCAACGAAA